MAIGDLWATIVSVAASSTLTVQPAAGDEWVIHNFYASPSGTFDLVAVNGSALCTIEVNCTMNLTGYFFHASNTQYWRMINKTAGAIICGYDAIETK